MENLFNERIKNLQKHQWTLHYDKENHTAKMMNEIGDSMDIDTFSYCMDALKNEFYDINESKYGREIISPYDELTRKRRGILDYKLIEDRQDEESRSVFEVFSDDNGIFTLNNYMVYKNRKKLDSVGFQAHMNYFEAREVLETLESYIERHKDYYRDK